MDGQRREALRRGMRVAIVLKKDQRSGKRTTGVIKDILTSAAYHSRGIKVRLDDGQVGRVQAVLPDEPVGSAPSPARPEAQLHRIDKVRGGRGKDR